jgi:hypothetical protein
MGLGPWNVKIGKTKLDPFFTFLDGTVLVFDRSCIEFHGFVQVPIDVSRISEK